MKQKLSILVPVHNEAPGIPSIYRRLKSVVDPLTNTLDWEIVFLNNASADTTLEAILEIRKLDPGVKIITLSRDFGYQGSLLAGLNSIESDLYMIVDGDGEDPPELLPEFYRQYQQGAQIIYGIRSNRTESRLITWCRGIFYQLNRRIADNETVLWMAEFSMMTRQVRDAVIATRTTFPFIRAEMAFVGFRRVGVPYTRGNRSYGISHYNFYRMLKFAVAGFLSSSTFPLRLILYTAFLVGLFIPGVAWLLHIPVQTIERLSFFFLYYFILLSVSMLALYLARTYKNLIQRPNFIIDRNNSYL